MTATSVEWWAAPLVVGAVLVVGAYVVAVVDEATRTAVAGQALRGVALRPLRWAASASLRQPVRTERPDAALAWVARSGYVGLAAVGLAVVPLWDGRAVADLPVGIVLWGTVEALAIAAVFLRGWAVNSLVALMAAYRFVAVGFAYLLLSMFVLIAAALPAESLRVGAIVDAQDGLWNVVRQPLGLPLFLVVALGTVLWGPMALGLGADLGGGTRAEDSGVDELVWRAGRAMMVVAFSAMAAAVFLGGWHGPALPGGVWMALKTLVVAAVLVVARHRLARVRAERFVTVAWTVLLPLGFLDLVMAGVETLA
jgi:NADH-quinone oxidoreductase subunit H